MKTTIFMITAACSVMGTMTTVCATRTYFTSEEIRRAGSAEKAYEQAAQKRYIQSRIDEQTTPQYKKAHDYLMSYSQQHNNMLVALRQFSVKDYKDVSALKSAGEGLISSLTLLTSAHKTDPSYCTDDMFYENLGSILALYASMTQPGLGNDACKSEMSYITRAMKSHTEEGDLKGDAKAIEKIKGFVNRLFPE